MRPLKIAIAGAGTAGLAAAAFLARDGHDVTLFERFEAPKPIGAGLLLQPTGLACLARLGLDRAAVGYGQVIMSIYGETVRGIPILDLSYRELGCNLFGLGVHRGTLFSLLYADVVRLGVPITVATDIVATRAEPAGRTLIDRHRHEHGPFELIVDATGVRSPLRAGAAKLRRDRPYAYGALWGIMTEPDDWPHKDRLVQRYHGCHTMLGLLPVGSTPDDADGRRLMALFWSLRVSDRQAWQDEGLEVWKARVLAVSPQAEPFLAQVARHADMTFASYADMVVDRCHGERIVLIGDAGRALSPQLGQGANLALIDAATLADSLRQAASLAAALAAYAAERRRHGSFYALASRWLTPFFQSDSCTAQWVRDLTFPLMGRVPYLRRHMVRTLAGVKTGLLTHLDPGLWHPDYALAARLQARQCPPRPGG
jgi:2-polyprenyl-6-methoxyphenol hydroxylase-like FAD-dependent oxidoreductase